MAANTLTMQARWHYLILSPAQSTHALAPHSPSTPPSTSAGLPMQHSDPHVVATPVGKPQVREHFMAGKGLGFVPWFFSMAATLFSGYSVSGIVNEAYNNGWTATRWIPAGVQREGAAHTVTHTHTEARRVTQASSVL